jgi:hypothetical protein
MVVRAVCLALASACASCAAAPPGGTQIPNAPLVGPRGEALGVRGLAELSALTVLVFFSPDCDCLTEHDARLVAIADAYRSRGVRLFMVDSEARGSLERDAAEGRRRRYSFPILLDRSARVADLLGAEYSSYAVVIDASGRVRYRGGIDSDKLHLHDDATPYLRNALDDLLSGREPRLTEGKALGCALQRW